MTELPADLRDALAEFINGSTAQQVEACNALRRAVHDLSPLRHHPIDLVEWVPIGSVQANAWNPNEVAPPEMELLRLSISADGYTQPVVTSLEGEIHEVVDGFHRTRVGHECEDVQATLHGFLPIVRIRAAQTDTGDRMASTIRHNRARGKHTVVKMTDIVLDLKRRNWSDAKIGKQLGMDDDEVLRLSQIGGLAATFADREFSMAWDIDPDDDLVDEEPVDAEAAG